MDSPFASKLKTNYCPTVDETVEIKALIAENQARMEHLESRIADAQQVLNKLLEERESLDFNLDSHEALLSPIRRMPADVVQEIFKACLPTHRNCVMDASEAPLLLGRICSGWRTLSLATPRLWSSLHIVDPGQQWSEENGSLAINHWHAGWGGPVEPPMTAVDRPRVSLIANAIQEWFERSGQCPLSISWHLDCRHRHNSAAANSRCIVEAVFSRATRWQHIKFTIGDAVLEDLAQLSVADVPELKCATLQQSPEGWGNSGGHFTWDRLRIFLNAKVTAVAVSGLGLVLPQLALPWTQLTALSTFPTAGREIPVSVHSAITTISRCSQLRSLSLLLASEESTTTEISTSSINVDLPLLHSLRLSGTVGASTALLDRISIPKLTELAWTLHPNSANGAGWGGVEPRPIPAEPLVRFLTTLPLLESLSLTARQLSSSSIKEVLLNLPTNLQSLHVSASFNHTPSFDEDCMVFLMTPVNVGVDSSTPLPLLRNFQLDGAPSVSDATLLRFITSRASTLKRVHVTFGREMQVDIRPDLLPLIGNGLKLFVNYYPVLIENHSPWAGLPDAPQISTWGLPAM
ncbi:hypothetical protein FB45DRAFT_909430 [Roridomyces roridus]|uniref:F-box domain-containing protein n=1 Tax=Roridomyces roridus TaxID=1738132 RepID=A0AAD7BZ03_9AGAR|nr:hypothetical protein FB45DRAFT_909430 [Roridomyces roridus]